MPSRAGSANKNKAFLLKRLQDMYGEQFHPIMRMAEQAVELHEMAAHAEGADRAASLKASIDAWDKIAQYTEPKLKAVEVSGDPDRPVGVTEIQRVIVDPPA